MIGNAELWLKAAALVCGPARAEWIKAMRAECETISNVRERKAFGLGCFKAAVSDGVRSRRGLSYIARYAGAVIILIFSGYAFGVALKFFAEPQAAGAARLIAGLCLYYAICAGFLIVSLRGLQFFAVLGFALAVIGRIYIGVSDPAFEYLTAEFLNALSFEVAALMAGFFMAGLYLNWLYCPERSCD